METSTTYTEYRLLIAFKIFAIALMVICFWWSTWNLCDHFHPMDITKDGYLDFLTGAGLILIANCLYSLCRKIFRTTFRQYQATYFQDLYATVIVTRKVEPKNKKGTLIRILASFFPFFVYVLVVGFINIWRGLFAIFYYVVDTMHDEYNIPRELSLIMLLLTAGMCLIFTRTNNATSLCPTHETYTHDNMESLDLLFNMDALSEFFRQPEFQKKSSAESVVRNLAEEKNTPNKKNAHMGRKKNFKKSKVESEEGYDRKYAQKLNDTEIGNSKSFSVASRVKEWLFELTKDEFSIVKSIVSSISHLHSNDSACYLKSMNTIKKKQYAVAASKMRTEIRKEEVIENPHVLQSADVNNHRCNKVAHVECADVSNGVFCGSLCKEKILNNDERTANEECVTINKFAEFNSQREETLFIEVREVDNGKNLEKPEDIYIEKNATIDVYNVKASKTNQTNKSCIVCYLVYMTGFLYNIFHNHIFIPILGSLFWSMTWYQFDLATKTVFKQTMADFPVLLLIAIICHCLNHMVLFRLKENVTSILWKTFYLFFCCINTVCLWASLWYVWDLIADLTGKRMIVLWSMHFVSFGILSILGISINTAI